MRLVENLWMRRETDWRASQVSPGQ